MHLWLQPQGQCLRFALGPRTRQLTRCFSVTTPRDRSKPATKKPPHPKPRPNPLERKGYSGHVSLQRIARIAASRKEVFTEHVQTALKLLKSKSDSYNKGLVGFSEAVTKACAGDVSMLSSDKETFKLKSDLQQVYIEGGIPGLTQALKVRFRTYKYDSQFAQGKDDQKAMVDFRNPTEWYPVARAMRRRIHLHVGPTNSGKTYQALQRLEAAKSGFYAGPLRLLAHEVYTRLSAQGIPCGLITGDEVRISEENPPAIYSNTVEMVPLGKEVDVGVIDEIQMIGDENRGWAWTRALLGSRAHELHLCGEERIVPLIRELASLMGDQLEVHHYERLNPLMAMTTSLRGDLRRLEKGDCVVAFSRVTIHALKQEIEKATGRRAAIVYGGLPAEIRAQQADLFNDPNNDYDYLVASDAIGMGLNLSCKRIIFESVVKRLATGPERLSISQVKQIGGRAGRYRSARPDDEITTLSEDSTSIPEPEENIGLVTTLEEVDLPYVQQALNTVPEPISAAGLYPPDYLVESFCSQFPTGTSFAYILERLDGFARTNSRFFHCSNQDTSKICDVLDSVKGLSVADKVIFLSAPISIRDPVVTAAAVAFATCVAQNKSGSLLDIPDLNLEIIDEPVSGEKNYLRSLESLHRAIILYLWLGFRCGGVFTDRSLATHVKEMVEAKMDRALTEFSSNAKLRRVSLRDRQIAISEELHALEEAEERKARHAAFVMERQQPNENTKPLNPGPKSDGVNPTPSTLHDSQSS